MARFKEGVAGCDEEECEVRSSMDLPDLVAYLDNDLEPTNKRAANKKFASIFEAVVGHQRHLEEERKERRRIAKGTREAKRRQGEQKKPRADEHGETEDTLF